MNRPTLGILGPVASYDLGDWALLLSNINDLSDTLNIRIFSYDPGITKQALKTMNIGTTFIEIKDFNIINRGRDVQLCKTIDTVLTRLIGKIVKVCTVVLLNASRILPRRSQSKLTLNKQKHKEYSEPFFGRITSTLQPFSTFFESLVVMTKGRKITRAAICYSSNPTSTDNPINRLLKELNQCDVMLGIGGAYLNKHWGVKMYPFLYIYRACSILGIPLFLSGQNIGPISFLDKCLMKKSLQKVTAICLRTDNAVERSELRNLGFSGELDCAGDDAIFLEKDTAGADEVLASLGVGSRFAILNISFIIEQGRMPSGVVYRELASFLQTMIENHECEIVFLPMGYERSAGYKHPSDRRYGALIQERLSIRGYHVIDPVSVNHPSILKGIVSKSCFVMSLRLHPIVFAIGEKKPFLGIVSAGAYQTLYTRKILGVVSAFGFDPDLHTISRDSLDARTLEKRYTAITSSFKIDDKKYNANAEKRKIFIERVNGISREHKEGVQRSRNAPCFIWRVE